MAIKSPIRAENLEPGDVVGVVRSKALGLYEHYAVYIGDGKVVHYSGNGTDFNGGICIRKDSLKNFLKEDDDYFVLFFDKTFPSPRKIYVKQISILNDVTFHRPLSLPEGEKMKIYSAKDTIARALSRLGESQYNLVTNNCEHFAIWCKTGMGQSYQVKNVINLLGVCCEILS